MLKKIKNLKEKARNIELAFLDIIEKDSEECEEELIKIYRNTVFLKNSVRAVLNESVTDTKAIEKNLEKKPYFAHVLDNHFGKIIVINDKILHRKVKVTEKNDIIALPSNTGKVIDNAVIVYEHVYPKDTRSDRIYDNDNYNQEECKTILDSIVDAGYIKTDDGLNCFVMHITTLGDELLTKIHIIESDKFGDYYPTIK